MSNPFEDLRQAVVVRPMNSPGPQGAAAPEMKVQYSNDGSSWHNDPVDTDRYLRFSTNNGISWSDAVYFNNLVETLEWVEKAKQWAENPENAEVEPGQYSALHHALQAKKAEITAGEYAIDAAGSANEAFGAAAPAWDSETVYSYNDVVSFDNGHTYRCIGTDIVGIDHAPNINGVDNEAEWTRITVSHDGYFEVDENGDLMPMITPITSEIFMLDENGDIMHQEYIDAEIAESYGKLEFINSVADFRAASFVSTTEYVYVKGYYGANTPGGGLFYRDPESSEADNGGTVIVDSDNVRWKRANVHEEYYASWFGVSTEIEDNSPLIQNIFNVIPLGSILIFGPGTYRCKQTITFPYHNECPPESYIGITIQGSAKLSSFYYDAYTSPTILEYTGPDESTLTPFFDFRCASDIDGQYQYFKGTIRNIHFKGLSAYNKIVSLWFYRCIGSLFDNILFSYTECGIRIDEWYFYSYFNGIQVLWCNYGIQAYGTGNNSVFNFCKFQSCINTAFSHNLNKRGESGIYFNNCYFENGNGTAIKTYISQALHINHCYFESNKGYNIDILDSDQDNSPLLVLENSHIDVTFHELTSNKAFIRQTLAANKKISYVIRENTIYDVYPGSNDFDYFIYVASGNVVIKAENNILRSPFPICSKTPLDSSYFNNDFS